MCVTGCGVSGWVKRVWRGRYWREWVFVVVVVVGDVDRTLACI